MNVMSAPTNTKISKKRVAYVSVVKDPMKKEVICDVL
jgi:hypothetical protein